MPHNSIKKYFLIVFTRMGLLIWLEAYFKAKTLRHTSRPVAGICIPFWIHLRVPKCPKTAYKHYFLVVSDYFSYKNVPIPLDRGLFSSLDIGTNNLPTCRPQKCIKSYFLVVLDYFTYKNGPIDLIRGLFSNLDVGTNIPPTCGPCVPFWVQLRVPKWPKTA
jgi:hypothetical protein